VPRLLANSEVEGGETLWTPDGKAGRIEGASHANGGIPVNMEEGTRIFSEKLKDPDTKKSWGKIAAKYSTDKLIPAIEKEEDPLRKSSMQLEAYLKNKKLEETFAKQEQLKLGGFYGDDIMIRSQQNHLEKELGGVYKFGTEGEATAAKLKVEGETKEQFKQRMFREANNQDEPQVVPYSRDQPFIASSLDNPNTSFTHTSPMVSGRPVVSFNDPIDEAEFNTRTNNEHSQDRPSPTLDIRDTEAKRAYYQDWRGYAPDVTDADYANANDLGLNIIRDKISKGFRSAEPDIANHFSQTSPVSLEGGEWLEQNNLLPKKGTSLYEKLEKAGNIKDGHFITGLYNNKKLDVDLNKEFNEYIQSLPEDKKYLYGNHNAIGNLANARMPDILTFDAESPSVAEALAKEKGWTKVGNSYVTKEGVYQKPKFPLKEVSTYTAPATVPADKVAAATVAAVTEPANTANKIVAKQTVNPEVSINGWIPDTYGRTPLNYFNTEAQTINPRHLNVQDDINQIDRSTRTVESNLGDRSTGSIANALQAQINAMNAKNQVFSRKNQYDKEADQNAQQFNAGQRAETNERNRGSWFSMLENPIRTREEAITRQKMTDSRAAQERGEKYQKDLTTLKDIATRQGVLSTPEMLQLYASLSPEQRKSILGSKGGLDLTKLFG
jgi:hypothetical protein